MPDPTLPRWRVEIDTPQGLAWVHIRHEDPDVAADIAVARLIRLGWLPPDDDDTDD